MKFLFNLGSVCPLGLISVFVLVVLLPLGGCATALSWGRSEAEPRSYYYFILSNYEEMSHNDQAAIKNMKKAAEAVEGSYYLELETAKLYSRAGDNEKALTYARQAIERNPAALEARLFTAWLAAIADDWLESERQYREVLQLDPGNLEALSYLGALYAEHERYQEATDTFKRLIEADPDSSLTYYYLGRLYYAQNQVEAAIKALSTAVRKNPEFTAALTELALAYEQVENLPAAEETYRALIKVRPEANMPKARLARLLLKTGRKAEAEELLKAAGGRAQDSSQAQLQIGLIYMDQNLYREAIREFGAVLAADPQNDQARYLLATALFEDDDAVKAREHLMRIPPRSSLYVDARLLLSSTPSSRDPRARLEESLAIIISALKNRDDDSRLWMAQAMFLQELGDEERAHRVLLEALTHFPEEAELHFRLGVIEDRLGDKAVSIGYMREAIRLNPDHAEALNYAAYTWAERKENLDEALEMARRAAELKPDSGYIVDTIGWIYYMMGEYEAALTYLERAAYLSNDDPAVMEHLGDTLTELGRPNSAWGAYQRARVNGHEDVERLNEKIKKLGF